MSTIPFPTPDDGPGVPGVAAGLDPARSGIGAAPLRSRLGEAIGLGWHVALLDVALRSEWTRVRAGVGAEHESVEGTVAVLARTIGFRVGGVGIEPRDAADALAALSVMRDGPSTDLLSDRTAALENFHGRMLPALARIDLRFRNAYELGRRLSETAWMTTAEPRDRRPGAFRQAFDPIRLVPLGEWIASIADDLTTNSASSVLESLFAWSCWTFDASDEECVRASREMRRTVRSWRDVLLGRGTIALRPPPIARRRHGPRLDLVSLAAAFPELSGGGERSSPFLYLLPPIVADGDLVEDDEIVLDGPVATDHSSPPAASAAPSSVVELDRPSPVFDQPSVAPSPAAVAAPPIVPDAPPAAVPAPPLVDAAPSTVIEAATTLIEAPVADDLVVVPSASPEPAILPEPTAVPEVAPAEALETGEPGAYVAPLTRPRHSAQRAARFRVRTARMLFESAAIIAAAVAVVLVLRVYVVQTFTIPTNSMMPTLLSGDRVLVDKVPRALLNIHLGDMIAFRRVKADTSAPAGSDLIKRVVGLPGQYISSSGDTIYLNGKVLREPWLPKLVGSCAERSLGIKAQRIASNHFYVLGDCRGISYDSRAWGTVPRGDIIGKVTAVVWRHSQPWLHWF